MDSLDYHINSEYLNYDCCLELVGAVIRQAIKDLKITESRIGANKYETGLMRFHRRTADEFLFKGRRLEDFLHKFGVDTDINADFIRKFARNPDMFAEMFKRMEIDNWNEKKSQYDEDKKYIKKRKVPRETVQPRAEAGLRNNGNHPPVLPW